MYDAGKVITGIVIFLVLITFPFWFNVASGNATYKPDPKIITPNEQCMADGEYMKRNHMDMLDEWRDLVVREGQRTFVAPDGKTYEMSLSNTCMKCHSNKADFCDQCHNYMAVYPYCWDCHIEPQETTYGYK
ncbi:MAG: sulfate reduction electron transfer complex DsrMKJOP subunit DsrJ [candidate division Zixibacteria bacterium]|nr:sulfate reduction electron transfer complex DsrMKJOP subunit DsrJ [candidate division Zixibacteria bacterium]